MLAFGTAALGVASGLTAASTAFRGGKIVTNAEIGETLDEFNKLHPEIEAVLQRSEDALNKSRTKSTDTTSQAPSTP